MHQALHITEILELILRYTSPLTSAACARVCRAWHQPALDVVWYHLPRLDALFRLLGPMEKNEAGQYCFIQPHISPERWDRFMFYAKRTRHLHYSRHPSRHETIHPHTFSTVAISRPFLHLLPNLTHLSWSRHEAAPSRALMLSILFLSPHLKSLVVQSQWEESKSPNREFFHHVVARSPHLQHLSILSEYRTPPELDTEITDAISALHDLRSVTLSDTLFTTNVFKVLSTCPHLEVISQKDALTLPFDIIPPILKHGAFPNLKEMHIRMSLTNLVSFLRLPFPTARLQRLSVATLGDEEHATITQFFEIVGNCCHNIQSLELNVHHTNPDNINDPLPFTTLEPLLACKSLISLSIVTPLFLDLDNSHIALMVAHWPHIRKLYLTPQPLPCLTHRIRLTFEVFPILARLRPEIEHLGIYVYPTIPTYPCGALPNLRQLVLGSNTMQFSADDVAFFLTDTTPPTCTFVVEYLKKCTAPYHLVLESGLYHVAKHLEAAVLRVPVMRKVDEEYRERIDALEREIRKLRASLD